MTLDVFFVLPSSSGAEGKGTCRVGLTPGDLQRSLQFVPQVANPQDQLQYAVFGMMFPEHV